MNEEIVFEVCFGCFHNGDECRECNVREYCIIETKKREAKRK